MQCDVQYETLFLGWVVEFRESLVAKTSWCLMGTVGILWYIYL